MKNLERNGIYDKLQNMRHNMDYRNLLVLLSIAGVFILSAAQHENMPYQDVEKICETCVCLTAQDADKRYHHVLNCATKNFKHILARWPEDFGRNHNGIDIVATFSGNSIAVLQQLPATNATLTFSCSRCGIKDLQAPTFMDVPNIKRLDLSWNDITADELSPDVFRGPYRATHYEPIALTDLDLSHNKFVSLDKKTFEHTPNLTKLNLSYNMLKVLDNQITMALASANNLQVLDLAYTGIKEISSVIFKALINLQTLNLAGNQFTMPPDSLQLVGKSLNTLNLAGNPIVRLYEQSLLGLKVLKRLNVSDMNELKAIAKGTFTRLETLEYLYCAHNPKMFEFDLDSLMHCTNLTHLDISHCSISTLSLAMDLSAISSGNSTNATLPKPWPKLRTFETVGNPWLCDCQLFQILEYAGTQYRYSDAETRCDTPYFFAGARFSNLTATQVCSMQLPKKFTAINEDPPRFLRKRYIILTVIIASVVIVLGLIIGFLVACIRRRLKRADFGVEPIRYTSVRSSNLSAFSHVNPVSANGTANNAGV